MTVTTLPLLPAQQPKWDAYRRAPDAASNWIDLVLEVDGDVDEDALRASLDRLEAEQPALRSTFHEGPGGEGVQVVHGPLPSVVAAPSDTAARRRPALSLPHPLVAVLEPGGLRPRLSVAVPSLAADGWSMGVFMRDLVRGYRSPSPPDHRVVDERLDAYAAACISRSEGARREPTIAAFADWLRDVPRLRLAYDADGPLAATGTGAEIRTLLDADRVDALSTAARSAGVTTSVLCLSAFAETLAREAGQDWFVLSAFVAGRTDRGEQDIMGRFARMLPLVVDLRGAAGPWERRRRVAEAWWDSFDYYDVPSAVVAARTGPGAGPGRLPFCDVAFTFNIGEPDLGPAAPPRFRRCHETTTISPQHLTLFVGGSAGKDFEVRLEYRSDLFDPSSARRILDAYLGDLDAVVDHEPSPTRR